MILVAALACGTSSRSFLLLTNDAVFVGTGEHFTVKAGISVPLSSGLR